MNSKHYLLDRKNRENLIKEIGYGKTVKTVVVDRHHRNGPEVHVLSDTGIVTIYNQQTGILITKLIARPGQIKRYFKENEKIPADLLELARQHERMNLNV